VAVAALRRQVAREQPFVGRNQERGGLACTRLCLARNVMLRKRNRQCTGLNRRAKFEPGITDTRLHSVVQRERVESEIAQMVICHRCGTGKMSILGLQIGP